MRITSGDILVRDFSESDLPRMLKWLTDERVLEYYEGRDAAFTMDTLSDVFRKRFRTGSESSSNTGAGRSDTGRSIS